MIEGRSVSRSGKDQHVIVYPLIISVASFPGHFQIYLTALEKKHGGKIKSGSGLGTTLMYQMFYQYNNTLVIHWQTHMHARCASIVLGKMMKHSADTKLGTKLIVDMHAGLPFAFPTDTLDRSVSHL